MSDIGIPFLLLLAMLTASCTNDPSDEGSSNVDVERDCESFCERAVSCSSEEFAESWEFESVSECVDTCLVFTHNGVVLYPSRPCEEITSAMWSCAAALPTCEDFARFEDAAYAISPGLENEPCGNEISEHLLMCN